MLQAKKYTQPITAEILFLGRGAQPRETAIMRGYVAGRPSTHHGGGSLLCGSVTRPTMRPATMMATKPINPCHARFLRTDSFALVMPSSAEVGDDLIVASTGVLDPAPNGRSAH